MAVKPLPSRDYLRQILDYDPDTGHLTWKPRPIEHFPSAAQWKRWNTRFAGTRAGAIVAEGYRAVTINNVPYRAHRLIWKLVHGEDPALVDHRSGEPDNNRLDNLRNCTYQQNVFNVVTAGPNQLGARGVRPCGSGYQARISIGGQRKVIGTFRTLGEATAARREEEMRLYGEFAPTG